MKTVDLGLIDYASALEFQTKAVEKVSHGGEDTLILCEHPHVYTLGKSADEGNMLVRPEFLEKIGAQMFRTQRGGDITYHGPGQLVGYPILNLNRRGMGVRRYVETLEELIILTLKEYELLTERVEGLTGIWMQSEPRRKIAAIGIKLSRGITMHGFALNVQTDLSYFNHIVPCGLHEKGVTSMQKELHREIRVAEVGSLFANQFNSLLG